VASWKYRACIIELDAHVVVLSYRQQARFFVAVAVREIEYAIADAQRFTGGVHITQPHRQTGNRPVGRDIERSRFVIVGHTDNWLKAACVDRPGPLDLFQERDDPRKLQFAALRQTPKHLSRVR
jgi:hypothetical protein